MLAEAIGTVDFDPTVLYATRSAWRDAVSTVAEKAKATLPDCTGRVDKAVQIVLAGDVEILEGGTANVFSEAADATPANVAPRVKAHFPRMALTRAKARALRDALNMGMCSLEELSE